MMTNVVLACHPSWGLPPYRVLGRHQSTPSIVFLPNLVGWLKRGVTLCFVTRKRLNSSVLSGSCLAYLMSRMVRRAARYSDFFASSLQGWSDHSRQVW